MSFDLDKWTRQQETRVADALLEAMSAAMGFDQMLYMEIEKFAEPIIKQLKFPPRHCGRCKIGMPYIEWVLAQGICGACAGAIMAESERSNTP